MCVCSTRYATGQWGKRPQGAKGQRGNRVKGQRGNRAKGQRGDGPRGRRGNGAKGHRKAQSSRVPFDDDAPRQVSRQVARQVSHVRCHMAGATAGGTPGVTPGATRQVSHGRCHTAGGTRQVPHGRCHCRWRARWHARCRVRCRVRVAHGRWHTSGSTLSLIPPPSPRLFSLTHESGIMVDDCCHRHTAPPVRLLDDDWSTVRRRRCSTTVFGTILVSRWIVVPRHAPAGRRVAAGPWSPESAMAHPPPWQIIDNQCVVVSD